MIIKNKMYLENNRELTLRNDKGTETIKFYKFYFRREKFQINKSFKHKSSYEASKTDDSFKGSYIWSS